MTISEQDKKVLTPQDVRNILKTDNQEIVKLCKKALISPRKDNNGQTYFSEDDVKSLKKAKTTASIMPLPSVNSNIIVNNLLSNLKEMEERMTKTMSKTIDEKLDGMDEVVVELIRCKTENESLRMKLNELNKENYHLKNHLTSYKAVGLGLYVKKAKNEFDI